MANKKLLDAIRGLRPIPENERHNYDITDLKVGGYFRFRNQNWLVLDISRYLDVKWKNFARRKKDDWTVELTIFSLKTGETGYIEYYEDDEVEIYFTEKEIKLRVLGITRSDLADIEDEEEGTIHFEGVSFDYSDNETSANLYFAGYMNGDEDRSPEDADKVRFYEFEAANGNCITIEAWVEDATDDRPDREAYLSSEVNTSDIVVLQLSK